MSLGFKRIQFTPDLMPSDITGTELLQEDPETHERRFKFPKGSSFYESLLADEINRTPPKNTGGPIGGDAGKEFHREAKILNWMNPSLFWPHRIRSSRKEPILCRRLNWIASYSISWSNIQVNGKNWILCVM